uniref:Lipoprotein n=1 Tax=uncultured Alphaproteobacteria bacterium TaxID=91750 RepID=A0A6M4NN90_9PROT|nr:hypothetical protein PlAlph_2440 [uncultured Alphaproteobacteria bacterium]
MKNVAIKVFAAFCALGLAGCASDDEGMFPSLLGSDSQENIYANSSNVVNGSYTGTFVGQRVSAFRQELSQIKQAQKSGERELEKINANISNNASLYQKTISTVETKLQSGTTPGNPNMYAMLQQAQGNVQTMFANSNALENLSTKTANILTSVNYLENSIAAAFSISGAVDEDHKQLRELQNEAMTIAQKAAALNDNVTSAANFQQQSAIQASQEINALHESVKTGSNTFNAVRRPVLQQRTKAYAPVVPVARTEKPIIPVKKAAAPAIAANGNLPLFSVRFTDNNVDYKDGLNSAVKSALSRKPNASFEVVAISNGNNQNNAQQHASRIFEEVVKFGANANNVSLNARISEKASVAEVQVFVK